MNNYYIPPTGPPYGSGYVPPSSQFEPYRKPLRRSANIIGGGMLMLLGGLFGFSFLIYGAFSFLDFTVVSQSTLDIVEEALGCIIYTLAFWIPTVFIVMRIGIPVSTAFPLRRPRADLCIPAVLVALGASIVGSFVSLILSSFLEGLVGYSPYMPAMEMPEGVVATILYIISLAILPAVFEELLFRGAVMQSLRRFGDGFALVVSSLLFSLMHGNLVQGPPTFLLGMVMGYFVLRTGSLMTSIIIHFVNNGLVIVYEYLEMYLTEVQYEWAMMGVYAAYVIFGAAALVYLAVRHRNLFRVAPSQYPLPTAQKNGAFFSSITIIIFILLSGGLMVYYLA